MLRIATKMEKTTYAFLKRKKINFRYQWPFPPYCVDFFFPDILLVLEVDGLSHHSPDAKEYDEERTTVLKQKYNVDVIRTLDVSDSDLSKLLTEKKNGVTLLSFPAAS